MRSSLAVRLGSGAAASALALAGAIALAGPADAATKPPAATYLHLNSKVVAHARHHTDTITGKLTAHRKGVVGETVTLVSRTGKHRKWSVVTTAATGTGGAVSFTISAPATTTQYETLFAGDATNHLRKSHSNVITITVAKHHK